MALLRVKEKFQLTLPAEVRAEAGLEIGDYLEAKVGRGGVITLTPKAVVDRHVMEGLQDLAAGRTLGPFGSAKAAVAALERGASGGRRRK